MPKTNNDIDIDYLRRDLNEIKDNYVNKSDYNNLKDDVRELFDNRKWLITIILTFLILGVLTAAVRFK